MKKEDLKTRWREKPRPRISNYEMPEEETEYEGRLASTERSLRPNPFESEEEQRGKAHQRTDFKGPTNREWWLMSEHKKDIEDLKWKLKEKGERLTRDQLKALEK